ncbi:hypothetical protein L218DRAFT_1009483 [Marasmius fiardii PR-910]|nr:hypothetical protein L218DRAFT_1009483 [Marasmius fiardii PR-910]
MSGTLNMLSHPRSLNMPFIDQLLCRPAHLLWHLPHLIRSQWNRGAFVHGSVSFPETLSMLPIQHLYDSCGVFITETPLAFTIFRNEFDIPFALMFGFLLFVKSFHWLASDHIEWMDQRPYPGPPLLFYLRMLALFAILWLTDFILFLVAVENTLSYGIGGMVPFASKSANRAAPPMSSRRTVLENTNGPTRPPAASEVPQGPQQQQTAARNAANACPRNEMGLLGRILGNQNLNQQPPAVQRPFDLAPLPPQGNGRLPDDATLVPPAQLQPVQPFIRFEGPGNIWQPWQANDQKPEPITNPRQEAALAALHRLGGARPPN